MHALRLLGVVIIFWGTLGLSAAATFAQTHHDIELSVDPEKRAISILERLTVSGQSDVRIQLAPWMKVKKLSLNGAPVRQSISNGSLLVTLPNSGKNHIDVLASGIVPVRDPENSGWRAGSDPFAGREGTYLPGWVGWHVQTRERGVSYQLSIRVPPSYRAAATGALVSEELGADENVAVFKSQSAMESPSVFIGLYEVKEKQIGGLRLRTYFHQSVANLAQDYLDAATRFIEIFEEAIGSYPYPDFFIISAPLPVGLGFPNLTYVDRRILRLPFMLGRSLAHEVLHNWWGNGVQVDYDTGNWAEGLTTYMADHALAEQSDKRAGKEMRLSWLRDYAALPPDRDTPVIEFVAKQHDAAQVIGYGKVAFIFHMLKHELGSGVFDTVIKRFWQEHKFGVASWQDIKASFEATADTDLDWFFSQWTERRGAPRLRLEDARVSRRDGIYELSITLAQDAPLFRLNVPVRVATEAGLHRFDVPFRQERMTTKLELNARPVGLQVDPDHTVFRHLLAGEAPPILRDILLDKNARTLLATDDRTGEKRAGELAARLLRRNPNFIRNAQLSSATNDPLLVIGTSEKINSVIATLALPDRPAKISDRGSSRAWTVRMKSGKAVLFVEAEDPAALHAMMGPLPHYRSKSYIVFDGRRAVSKGVWPPKQGPLTRKLN